ncbi:MAG TPA: metal ABC transporter substrate-binding protein [Opitutaceae bacterium]|jgi:zinc/manganese transport system substrate-binding protein|nr:metal ABC transporter substrate-binding protein [Opitutaceae bacterium]
MRRFRAQGLVAALAAVSLVAAARAEPLRVVTLSTVLTEIAAAVGGEAVAVQPLLPPGVDPHTFEPAPRDVRSMAEADLILASGLGLEPYLRKLAANAGGTAVVMEAGEILRDEAVSGGRSEPDPHWWNSVRAAEKVTRSVAGEFAQLRPEAAAGFRARAGAYVRKLAALDSWAIQELGALPPARRRMVTTHDAFGWFARDYGFTVYPISGLSPEADPDARQLARLTDLIRREGIRAVFVENSENSKLAAALARETGARIGGVLYPDGLTPEPDGSTYERLFRHNVRTLADGLK